MKLISVLELTRQLQVNCKINQIQVISATETWWL